MFNFKNIFKGGKDTHIVTRVSENSGSWIETGNSTAPHQTAQSAMEIAAVSSAVKTIAESVASTPLRLMEITETEAGTTRKVLHNHWAARLLRSPNHFMTQAEFIEMMVAQTLLGKGSLALKTIVNKEVRELIPVPYGTWELQVLSNFDYQFVVQLADGRSEVFRSDQVLYLKGLSLDGYSGLSTIEKARKSLGLSSSLEDQQLNLLGNGGRPSGILTFADTVSTTQSAAIKAAWTASYGKAGKGGVAVLHGDTKFTEIQVSPLNSQAIENRRFQVEEIARVFRLPTAFFGLSPITSEVMRTFVQTTLRPHYVRLEQSLAKQILSDDPRFVWDFDELDNLRGDFAGQAAFWAMALGAGGTPSFMSVNEVRNEIGKNPVQEEWAMKPLRGGYEGSNGTMGEDPE